MKTLSIKQMQHLRSLGLDCSKASMYWETLKSCNSDIITTSLRLKYNDCDLKSEIGYGRVLTFTLDDILDILPKNIEDVKLNIKHSNERWNICYTTNDFCIPGYANYNILEAAYQMLVWCIENGHIKTNKNERN